MSQLPEILREQAESQRGMVTRRQALRAGLTRSAIGTRMGTGRWRRIYPGVLATFSGEPSREALLWAAVLRAGPGAALSHETAAELHGLARKPARLIHLTVPADRRVEPVPGLAIHRSARIAQHVIRARRRRAPGSRRPCSISRTQRGPSTMPSAGRAPPAAAG